jgi:hypothetical protein
LWQISESIKPRGGKKPTGSWIYVRRRRCLRKEKKVSGSFISTARELTYPLLWRICIKWPPRWGLLREW